MAKTPRKLLLACLEAPAAACLERKQQVGQGQQALLLVVFMLSVSRTDERPCHSASCMAQTLLLELTLLVLQGCWPPRPTGCGHLGAEAAVFQGSTQVPDRVGPSVAVGAPAAGPTGGVHGCPMLLPEARMAVLGPRLTRSVGRLPHSCLLLERSLQVAAQHPSASLLAVPVAAQLLGHTYMHGIYAIIVW